MIVQKQLRVALAFHNRQRQIGSSEGGARDELPKARAEVVHMGSGNKHAAKNDVLIKKLHYDQSLVFVKIQNFGNRSGVALGLSD